MKVKIYDMDLDIALWEGELDQVPRYGETIQLLELRMVYQVIWRPDQGDVAVCVKRPWTKRDPHEDTLQMARALSGEGL